MIIVINRENWEIHTGHRGFDCFQKPERLSLIKFVKCVYVLNKDERVGVKDQATAVYIGRKNSVYFVLVPTTNSRMHNAMLLAFGGCFAESVGCDKVMWA